MRLSDAKKISIEALLSSLGINPIRIRGDDIWYLSPLRIEKTASFKVNRSINCWYDFGIGRGGTILDLVAELNGHNDIKESIKDLTNLENLSPVPKTNSAKHSNHRTNITSVRSIASKTLVDYIQRRSIPIEAAAKAGLREVHYEVKNRKYFALAFPNNSENSCEIRNPYFKGTIGKKDISFIAGANSSLNLFEGFFDYLSAIALNLLEEEQPTVVLNSVGMIERAVNQVKSNESIANIRVFRDRDNAGIQLLKRLGDELPRHNVIDVSGLWAGHNDLNEWHCSQSS